MIKTLKVFCLMAVLSGFVSAQIAPALLNWSGSSEDTSLRTVPKTLAETGFDKTNTALFKPYTVNVPQWRNFIQANRYIYLPPGQKVVAGDSINYTFPAGTVLIRDCYIDLIQGNPASRKFVEAQFQIMKADGQWARMTYVYNDDGTAQPVVDTSFFEKKFVVNLNGQNPNYTLPTIEVNYMRSAFDCASCHYTSANGFITQQLNDGVQLNNLVTAGVLAAAPNTAAWKAAGKIDRWYSFDHPTGTMEQKFFSYLAGNCSRCHNPVTIALEPNQQVTSYEYFSRVPSEIINGENLVVVPGNPTGSLAIDRMTKTDNTIMPPAEVNMIDSAAVNNMIKYINSPEIYNAVRSPATGKPVFHATLNKNLLRFSRPGPAKLFDLTGKQIKLNRIDGSTFLVAGVLKPGIYIAKMGSRTIRVRYL